MCASSQSWRPLGREQVLSRALHREPMTGLAIRSCHQRSIQCDLPLIVMLKRELTFYFCPCPPAHNS